MSYSRSITAGTPTIFTVMVVHTENGSVFDICKGSDGMIYIRINNGKDEVVVSLTDDDAYDIETGIHDARYRMS